MKKQWRSRGKTGGIWKQRRSSEDIAYMSLLLTCTSSFFRAYFHSEAHKLDGATCFGVALFVRGRLAVSIFLYFDIPAFFTQDTTRLINEREWWICDELTTRTVLDEIPIPHSPTVKSTPYEVVYLSIKSERSVASNSCTRASGKAPRSIGFWFDFLIKL